MRPPGRETLTSRAGDSLIVTAPEEALGPLAQAEMHRARVRRRLAEARRLERPLPPQVAGGDAPRGDSPEVSSTDMCWDLCPRAGWSHFELLRRRFRTGVTSPSTASPGPGVLRPPLLADFLEVE
jgi:hypothetical protein